MDRQEIFRRIPPLDQMMQTETAGKLIKEYGYPDVLEAARDAQEELRKEIVTDADELLLKLDRMEMQKILFEKIQKLLKNQASVRMRRVINATGVILHTNLGRAPLSRDAAYRAAELLTGYTNLEIDLSGGTRGSRTGHFEKILCRLTGAEACLAVNNNAAAVLLMLSALTAGREVLVSRGELVEIGGKFRVPEVMEQSGTILREVGTTNRTYPEDYLRAAGEQTAALLKVSTSNYRMEGFVRTVSEEELVTVGRTLGIPVLADLGSSTVLTEKEMAAAGIFGVENVRQVLEKGVDLVCFSADKLLGGPQAGILAGRRDMIDKLKVHPLLRAVRIGKFTAAALEETFRIYRRGERVAEQIPVLEMMSRTEEKLRQMAEYVTAGIRELEGISAEIRETQSVSGGGTILGGTLPGIAVSLKPFHMSADKFAKRLRTGNMPVLGVIRDDQVLLDMRTVQEDELDLLTEEIRNAALAENP